MEKKPSKFLILRHDVDLRPQRSLKTARIECECGITTTYYFRIIKGAFNEKIIKEISAMGHEIGYHYEIVDKAKGNLSQAYNIFREELDNFRKIEDIKTICMHGNSRTRWDNRELWKEYDFRIFGLLGEAYLSINFDDIVYISDSSRSWKKSRHKILDIVEGIDVGIDSSLDLINLVTNEKHDRLYFLIHPDEWSSNIFAWIYDRVCQSFKNILKGLIKKQRWKTKTP